jgi:Na+-translocating ferredoxin:NAD+ oxidoreductase RnfG subunit
MKSILYILLIAFISSNLYAVEDTYDEKMKKRLERQQARMEREIAKIEQERNDPYNKQIRELEKKHFGKVVNGDKEQQKLQQDVLNSTKTSK